jgi:hypothetical protein
VKHEELEQLRAYCEDQGAHEPSEKLKELITNALAPCQIISRSILQYIPGSTAKAWKIRGWIAYAQLAKEEIGQLRGNSRRWQTIFEFDRSGTEELESRVLCRRALQAVRMSRENRSPRRRGLTDEERRKRSRASQRLHEVHRQWRCVSPGFIEKQFTYVVPTLYPESQRKPTGACLDQILAGESVKISSKGYCLESLFGMERHRIVKVLGRGRQSSAVNDYRAIIKIATALLNDPPNRGKTWIADREKRIRVLEGIKSHADSFSPQTKVTRAVANFAAQHLRNIRGRSSKQKIS